MWAPALHPGHSFLESGKAQVIPQVLSFSWPFLTHRILSFYYFLRNKTNLWHIFSTFSNTITFFYFMHFLPLWNKLIKGRVISCTFLDISCGNHPQCLHLVGFNKLLLWNWASKASSFWSRDGHSSLSSEISGSVGAWNIFMMKP